MAEAGLAPSGKIRFEALDGLRGLASLVVVLAHFCSATGVLMQWPGLFNAVLGRPWKTQAIHGTMAL